MWPGEYTRITLRLRLLKNVVTVPSRAVTIGPDGTFVYVVGDDMKARYRLVSTSVENNGIRVVTEGLNAGEKVVMEGHVRLADGIDVRFPESHTAQDKDSNSDGSCLMNMSAVFIKRPVATSLIMAGILIFGLLSYTLLPLNDMPNVEFPYITVIGEMSGANPETMATSVAKPLEKQISGIAGIKSLRSTNKQGRTMVMIEFELDRDIDGAALDVQSAISQAYSRMPDTMTEQPRFTKSTRTPSLSCKLP